MIDVRSCRYAHFTALGEFQRVRQIVPQDLRDLPLVGEELGHVGRFEDERNVLVLLQRSDDAAQPAEDVVDGELRGPDGHLASLDLGDVEQVVHEFGGCARRRE
jgi:hypothetical protein